MNSLIKQVGTHLLNPYVSFGASKASSVDSKDCSSVLGWVLHFNKLHPYKSGFRSQFELAFDPADSGNSTNVSLRQNALYEWKKAKFEVYNRVEFTKPGVSKSAASILTPSLYGVQGLLHAHFLNFRRFSGVEFGISYKHSKWLQVYALHQKPDFEDPYPATRLGLVCYPHEIIPELKVIRAAWLPSGAVSVQTESNKLFGFLQVSASLEILRHNDTLDISPKIKLKTEF